MTTTIVLVLLSVLIGSLGQVLLKQGVSGLPPVEASSASHLGMYLLTTFTRPFILLGLACYLAGTVIWLGVLSRLALNVAYPFLALSYIVVPLFAHYFLGETIPPLRWLGFLVIIIGVVVVAHTR